MNIPIFYLLWRVRFTCGAIKSSLLFSAFLFYIYGTYNMTGSGKYGKEQIDMNIDDYEIINLIIATKGIL